MGIKQEGDQSIFHQFREVLARSTGHSEDFLNRFDEQISKADLADREETQLGRTPIADNVTPELLTEIRRVIEYSAVINNDLMWVVGMLGAGVSDDVIMKVWDERDQMSRNAKDNTNLDH